MTHLTDALTKLEGLAQKATPGIRTSVNANAGQDHLPHWQVINESYQRDDESPDPLCVSIEYGCPADAELFAACSRETILALVRVARAAHSMDGQLTRLPIVMTDALAELERVMK